MPESKQIIFVCTGNLCRSPMAEAMFRHMVQDIPGYTVSSAGVCAAGGEFPSLETLEILTARGISTDGLVSKPLTKALIKRATHIFTMTDMHRRSIVKMHPKSDRKTYLVTEFCEINGRIGADIPDPIGLGMAAYEELYEMLKAALPTVFQFIEQTSR